jgi:hypothetical protein
MSRWPVLAAFSIALLVLGCGSSLRAGLSNAPRLGGTAPADEEVHDVVSNGDDACGLHAEHGVLRNRIPPCPRAVHPLAGAAWPSLAARSPSDGGLVVPWLQHFYVGWPCAHSPPRKEMRAVAWDVSMAPAASCGASGSGLPAPGR